MYYVGTWQILTHTYKIRVKLRGKGGVNLNSRFNIDRVIYNEITFDLDEVIAYILEEFLLIYKIYYLQVPILKTITTH